MVRDAGLNRTCFFFIVEHHRLGKVTFDDGVRIRVVQFSHVGDVHFIGVGETFLNLREEISKICLLYTSPSPRDREKSRMPSSA